MSEKIAVELGDVQITMLIPLLGRAVETQKKNGLLQDHKAVEIIASLDYDFSNWLNTPSLVGANIRTLMLDKMVAYFIAQHPHGTVIEIGCGLNTRFERLDNGSITWFDLDLPDAIELRRKFFDDTERRTMIATSVLETGWMKRVKQTKGPWFFVSEAVIIYLDASQAKQAISQIADNFVGAKIAFDTTSSYMVKNQEKHDVMRYLPERSWFKWECDDPKQIETWDCNLSLLESKTFLDADKAILDKTPPMMRIVMRYLPFLLRKKLNGYRLNLFSS